MYACLVLAARINSDSATILAQEFEHQAIALSVTLCIGWSVCALFASENKKHNIAIIAGVAVIAKIFGITEKNFYKSSTSSSPAPNPTRQLVQLLILH